MPIVITFGQWAMMFGGPGSLGEWNYSSSSRPAFFFPVELRSIYHGDAMIPLHSSPSTKAYRRSLFLLALLLVTCRVQAQPGPMNFVYGYNTLAYSDTTSLVEFNYQFSEHGLIYKAASGKSEGELLVRLIVRDSLGRTIIADSWITRNDGPPAGGEQENRMLIGSRLFSIHPGSYRAQVYYEDVANSAHRDSDQFQLDVRSFAGAQIRLSDIEIASEITPGDDPSNPFYKNGYVILPNVSGIIVEPYLVLNTYMEVYNADRVPTSEFSISYALADSARRIFYQKDLKRTRPSAKGIVELNSLPLEELPSGDYYLIVKAYNGFRKSANDSSMVFRKFALRNPTKDSMLASLATASAVPADMPVDPIYAGLKEEEIDQEFAKVRYIAVEAEKKTWKELTGAEAKGRFLTLFWQRRDPSPGTPENENRDEYFKRLASASALYTSTMTPHGWDSDRGRILLQYGKPDGTDRHFQDYNRKPFEIWTYSQQGYQFVFVDRTQTGTFTLVHSTAPGEVRFEDWEKQFAMLDPHLQDQ
jgi:GWxTD domain-containing protein